VKEIKGQISGEGEGCLDAPIYCRPSTSSGTSTKKEEGAKWLGEGRERRKIPQSVTSLLSEGEEGKSAILLSARKSRQVLPLLPEVPSYNTRGKREDGEGDSLQAKEKRKARISTSFLSPLRRGGEGSIRRGLRRGKKGKREKGKRSPPRRFS